MIHHAMKYVQLSENVRAELRREVSSERRALDLLEDAERALVAAERELVAAYGRWRVGMKVSAEAGNERAATALERTTWDLT